MATPRTRFALLAVAPIALGLALAGCGGSSSGTAASAAATTAAPAAASASPTAADSALCQAFNQLADSPEAKVLNDDNANEDQVQQAMTSFAPSLRAFVGQYGGQVPPEVAQSFESVATEIDAVAALNDSSSLSDAGKAVAGLAKLQKEGPQIDAYTMSTCGTSLQF